jgi:hypothetical protein
MPLFRSAPQYKARHAPSVAIQPVIHLEWLRHNVGSTGSDDFAENAANRTAFSGSALPSRAQSSRGEKCKSSGPQFGRSASEGRRATRIRANTGGTDSFTVPPPGRRTDRNRRGRWLGPGVARSTRLFCNVNGLIKFCFICSVCEVFHTGPEVRLSISNYRE